MGTDYEHGDDPVPVGTEVEYFGSGPHGRYKVFGHNEPMDHDELGPMARQHEEIATELMEAYPDGKAYQLWPMGVPVKMDNGHHLLRFIRRTSFRVITKGNQ